MMAERRSLVADLSDSDTTEDSQKGTSSKGDNIDEKNEKSSRNGDNIQTMKCSKDKSGLEVSSNNSKGAGELTIDSHDCVDDGHSGKDFETMNNQETDGDANTQLRKDAGAMTKADSSEDVEDCHLGKDLDQDSNFGETMENVDDSKTKKDSEDNNSGYLSEEDWSENGCMRQNSGYVDDWQSGKDFIQTNLMMLDSETLTDVTFKVGEEGEIIRAHRFMLASRSCVFFAMCCGQMAETAEIEIPDIDPNAFRNFLRYLYTGVMALTADNALVLLYCSKKYCVKSLEQEVLEFCKSSICPDNACVLLEQACFYSEAGLQEAVLNVIEREPEQVFMTDGFPKLSHTTLDKVLDMDNLAAEEDVVFTAALTWAKEECRRQGKKTEMSDLREVLGDSIYKIRFPLMSQTDFVNLVGSKGILTDSERVRILESYISPKSPTDPFPKKPRNTGTKVYKIQRLVHGEAGHSLSRGSDALNISCNKSVKLLGIMLYSPANISTGALSFLQSFLNPQDVGNSITFYVTVVVRNAGNVRIGIHHEDVEVTADHTQLEIMLTSPVELVSEEKYTLNVLIEGSVRCWGVMNGMSRLTDPAGDVTWSFGPAPSKSWFEDSLKEGYISGLIYNFDK